MSDYAGPSLPQSLLDEINGTQGEPVSQWRSLHSSAHHRSIEGNKASRNNGNTKLSRRDFRKQQRSDKKQTKAQFFGAGQSNPKRHADREHEESPQRKKAKLGQESEDLPRASTLKKPSQSTPKSATDAKTELKAKAKSKPSANPTALERLAARSEPTGKASKLRVSSKKPRTQDEANEDAYIARLEAKLGRKEGKLSKEFEEDGLDGTSALCCCAASVN